MKVYIRLFYEAFLFAINALVVNKLRTFLSLLGVTIGIFAIISVLTLIDGMENGIRSSIESLGDNVVFIQKWPWQFGGEDYKWWDYYKRPQPKIEEAEELKRQCELAAGISFVATTNTTISALGTTIENITMSAVSDGYEDVRNFEIEQGRYFTHQEATQGKSIAVIGYNLAIGLYGNMNPVGRSIKIKGNQATVVGVFAREGESMIGMSADNEVVVPVGFGKRMLDLKNDRGDKRILVKAKSGIPLDELKGELTGLMRAIRKTAPTADADFALNETSIISTGFKGLFQMINLAGFIIGGFSIIVGGFGIANIMFVSVKERTQQIGIQKALGAKNFFILFQFLTESVVLCILGGLAGLLIIFIGTVIINLATDFEMVLSLKNILLGVSISVAIGLISGITPARSASKLDPVEAIRAV